MSFRENNYFSFSSAASHGLSFTFVVLGICHRSLGVRLESLGKHSQQQVCPGIVFIGAAVSQDSVGMLK